MPKWQPLPRVANGIAIFPFALANPSATNEVQEDSEPPQPLISQLASLRTSYFANLEVGDIIYAFEQLGEWYKGYVVSTFPPNSQPRCGIFPVSHVHIRSYLPSRAYSSSMTTELNKYDKLHDTIDELHPTSTIFTDSEEPGKAAGLSKEPAALLPKMPSLIRSNSEHSFRNSTSGSIAISTNRMRPLSLQEKGVDDTRPLPPTISQMGSYRTASGFSEPLVDMITSVLKEWCSYLQTYLRKCEYELFNQVKAHMITLFKSRRQLLSQTLSLEDLSKLRSELIHTILSGNKLQKLDSIVLHNEKGLPIDEKSSPLTALYRKHVEISGDSSALVENVYPSHSPSGFSSTPVRKRLSKSEVDTIPNLYHLFFDLKAFVASICLTGEYTELHFSLFNKTTSKFISEVFLIVLTSQGMPRDTNRIGRLRTLFSDLSRKDISDQVYLVCRIVRIGRTLLLDKATDLSSSSSVDISNRVNSTKIGNEINSYRRPFGCAVLAVSDILQAGDQVDTLRECVVKIFTPWNDTTFATLHESIINQTGEYEQSPRAESICVSFRVFQGQAQTLIREHPTLLLDIPLTSRLGFPDVVLPGDSRNAMHLTICSGDFQQGRRTTAKNIQVKVEVRSNTGNGSALDGAICRGSGEANVTRYESVVIYHSNNPRWDESIKIELTPDVFKSAHIFFTFRHCSSKEQSGSSISLGSKEKSTDSSIFAFAFLPLSLDNHHTIVSDDTHSLTLYKYDAKVVSSTSYLKSSTKAPKPSKLKPFESLDLMKNPTSGLVALKDSFSVKTFLCSTKLTHSESLVNLLHWKEALLTRHDMRSILKNFTFIGELEIVKFLQDIFDVLFDLLGAPLSSFQHEDAPTRQGTHQRQPSASGAGPTLDDLVFAALVFVLNIVSDRRFTNFRPVLDVYIKDHFSSPRVSQHLITSMRKLLSNPVDSTQAMALRSSIKAWEYLFKLIVKSWGIHRAEEKGKNVSNDTEPQSPIICENQVETEGEFKTSLWGLFEDINKLMSLTTPLSILGTQTIAQQYYHTIFQDLVTRFPANDLAVVAVSFVNSIASFRKGNLAHHRLRLVYQLIHGVLFDCSESRHTLVKAAVGWAEEYLEQPITDYADVEQWKETLRLNNIIVTEMLEKIHSTHYDAQGEVKTHLSEKEWEDSDIGTMLNILPLLLGVYHRLRQISTPTGFEHPGVASKHSSGLSGPLSPISSSPDLLPVEISDECSNIFGESASMILTLLSLTSANQLRLYFQTCLAKAERLQDIILLLDILHSILSESAFPKHWLNLSVLSLRIAFKTLIPLGIILKESLNSATRISELVVNIWVKFYTVLMFILANKRLKVETLTPQMQHATIYLLQDVRTQGPDLLISMWYCLESFKSRIGQEKYRSIILALLGPILDLNLSLHDSLRKCALNILYSIMVSEYEIKSDFKHMEVECFDRLEHLVMTEVKGDLTTYDLFVQGLISKIEKEKSDETLKLALIKLIDSVNKFLELLLNVRDLPDEDEYEDERIMGTMKLLKFIKIMNQDDIYIKYVHQLVDMHLRSLNFAEAGITLKLHVDLLDWSSTNDLEAMSSLDLPAQTTFQRKELLLSKILKYFDEGQAWEHGIEVCKELANQYEHVLFDYDKLAAILRTRAQLYENILHKERYYSEYFRVGFYGKGFPTSVRNKQYVYRGLAWEKISAFCDRIQNKHPSARLLSSNGAPSESLLYSHGQYLQITAVTPEPDLTLPILEKPDLVPGPVREYYEANEVNTFSFSRPVKKSPTGEMASPRNSTLLKAKVGTDANALVSPGVTDAVNEFLMLWTEKTIFVTEFKFPSLLRRAEVVSMVVKEQSPVENAVMAMESKTKELLRLEKKYGVYVGTDTSKVNSNPLAMALNGAIDAAVNGGVSMYKQAFLTKEFISQHPDKERTVDKLLQLIDDQTLVIQRCLEIHNRIAPAEMRPLHENLDMLFRKNFADELVRISAKKSTITLHHPPLSFDVSSSRNNNQSTPPSIQMSPTTPITPASNSHKYIESPQSLGLNKRDSQLSDNATFDPLYTLSSSMTSQSVENTSPSPRSSNPFTYALKRLSGGSSTTCSSMDGTDTDYQSLAAVGSPLATPSFGNGTDGPNLGRKNRWSLKKYRTLLERHLNTNSATSTENTT
ncbi:Deoxycytidine kinase 1 [Basidiobolus ranarum]|uniref:Deoxycytidine kinase 1 n=1 Tax=Basidiobolus ranarum TaxID=34480 RepID=A0ABR2X3E3_9FUNG